MRINIAQFRKEILDYYEGNYSKQAYQTAKNVFGQLKEDLVIEKFKDSLVTQEILAGPDAPDLSGATNGYGNLYSFIGFNEGEGEEQIALIQDILEKSIYIKNTPQITRSGNKIRWQFSVFVPSNQELISATPMPWGTSASWLESLEKKGIPGLNFYFFKQGLEASRSTAGIQLKNKKIIDRLDFRTVDYVFAIIENFKKVLR